MKSSRSIISTASGSYPNLQLLLHSAQLSVSDVEIVPAGTSLVPLFLEKKFDAVAVHLSQKALIEKEIHNLNVIRASDYTSMSTGHIITTRQFAGSRPETVKKFLRATKNGLDFSAKKPDEAVDIYLNVNPEAKPNREFVLFLWNEFVKEFHYAEGLPVMESAAHWMEVQDTLFDIGLIGKKTDVSSFYETNFSP